MVPAALPSLDDTTWRGSRPTQSCTATGPYGDDLGSGLSAGFGGLGEVLATSGGLATS